MTNKNANNEGKPEGRDREGRRKRKEENRGKDRQHVMNIDQGIEKEEWTGNEFFYY